MVDVNKALRVAYKTALDTTGFTSYYLQAPDNITGIYLLFRPISSIPVHMIAGATIKVTMQVIVHTDGEQYNDGDDCDDLAGKVYDVIYGTETTKLDLISPTFMKMIRTEMVSDTVNDYTLKDTIICAERIILFQHTIYIK